MMCIIQIVDGKPFEHPIMVENFCQAFPDIDLNNLPERFAWFERKQRPQINPDEEVFVVNHSEYVFDGKVWTDVWNIRPKTQEEKDQDTVLMYKNYKEIILAMRDQALANRMEEDAAVYQAEYDRVDAFSKDVPLIRRFFMPPRKDENGVWITNNAAGRAPNVIG